MHTALRTPVVRVYTCIYTSSRYVARVRCYVHGDTEARRTTGACDGDGQTQRRSAMTAWLRVRDERERERERERKRGRVKREEKTFLDDAKRERRVHSRPSCSHRRVVRSIDRLDSGAAQVVARRRSGGRSARRGEERRGRQACSLGARLPRSWSYRLRAHVQSLRRLLSASRPARRDGTCVCFYCVCVCVCICAIRELKSKRTEATSVVKPRFSHR